MDCGWFAPKKDLHTVTVRWSVQVGARDVPCQPLPEKLPAVADGDHTRTWHGTEYSLYPLNRPVAGVGDFDSVLQSPRWPPHQWEATSSHFQGILQDLSSEGIYGWFYGQFQLFG